MGLRLADFMLIMGSGYSALRGYCLKLPPSPFLCMTSRATNFGVPSSPEGLLFSSMYTYAPHKPMSSLRLAHEDMAEHNT